MLGIYVRLSKEDSDSNSINNQLLQGKQFAKLHNIEYKIYNEGEGLSGGLGIDERPQLNKLLEDVKSGLITTVWVRDQSRLERNTELWFSIVNILRDNNAKLYNSDKFIDLDNDEELFPTNIMSLINDMQRKKQGRLTKRAINDNFKQGKSHGVMPYGYTKDENGYLIIDEIEAYTVKEIFKLSLEGLGALKIAYSLDERGIKTRFANLEGTYKRIDRKSGKVTITDKKEVKWSGNSIRNIITNPIYKGERRHKIKTEIEYHKSPIIIEPQLWDKVNNALKNKRNFDGKPAKYNYLLKNVLRCGVCGRNYFGKMRRTNTENRYSCYSKRAKKGVCNNKSIKIDKVEKIVWDTLVSEMPNHVEEYLKENSTTSALDDINTELLKLEQEQNTFKSEHKNLIASVKKGLLSDTDISTEITTINTQLDSVKNRINNALERKESISNDLLKVDDILKDVGVLKEFSFDEKKELVEKYIDHITTVYRTDIKEFSNDGEYFLMINFKNTELPSLIAIIDKRYKTVNYHPRWAIMSGAMFHGYLTDLYNFEKD
tara:strand:+ start:2399 stop:4033 length:1635 start_codon:yes stop_codon:yes gene_type:complete